MHLIGHQLTRMPGQREDCGVVRGMKQAALTSREHTQVVAAQDWPSLSSRKTCTSGAVDMIAFGGCLSALSLHPREAAQVLVTAGGKNNVKELDSLP